MVQVKGRSTPSYLPVSSENSNVKKPQYEFWQHSKWTQTIKENQQRQSSYLKKFKWDRIKFKISTFSQNVNMYFPLSLH